MQTRGGPIGLELTVVIAQIFMIWWDRQLKMRMDENELRLRLYKQYVDDINVVMSVPIRGLKFVEDEVRVIFDQNLAGSEKEVDVQADRR